MRWTDLPGDRGPADDGGAQVLRRGDWEDLRQRLERLPAGHPSSPRDDAAADEGWTEEAGSSPGPADVQDRETGRHQDREAGERDAGRGGRETDQGRTDARGSGHDGRSAHDAAVPGQREAYRPWFTSGESPEPWFYADPWA